MRIFNGFFVQAFKRIEARLKNVPVFIPSVSGSLLFIDDYKYFSVPENVTIIVVENYENFIEAKAQEQLFDGLNPLFIWRFQNSSSIVDWLNQIPNTYIHFGDFDLKGLHIYLAEFKSKLINKASSFFIPNDIEQLFRLYGNRDLYLNQQESVKNIDFEGNNEIKEVYRLIKQYKMGVSQEVLIPDSRLKTRYESREIS